MRQSYPDQISLLITWLWPPASRGVEKTCRDDTWPDGLRYAFPMAEADLPALPEARDDILPENTEPWARIEASALGARMKRALRRIACGETYREAAQAEGYATHSDVYRMAQRYRLVNATSERIVNRCRNVADLSLEELERRLTEDPGAFSAKELGITAGIATDKVAKKERWGLIGDISSRGESPLEMLSKAAMEGKISLSMEVKPAPPRPGQETDRS